MSIVIIGEYSGFGKSLAIGFREIGHQCKVFSSDGDGWKKIDVDITGRKSSGEWSLNDKLSFYGLIIRSDVIFLMNPDFLVLHRGAVFLSIVIAKLLRKKIVLLCCGDDAIYVSAGDRGLIDRYMYKGLRKSRAQKYRKFKSKFLCYLAGAVSSDIVPVMIDYKIGWYGSIFKNKVRDIIPLCGHFRPSKVKKIDKGNIKILHGVNRPDVKGTQKIRSALERIKKEFDNVELYFPEKMQYNDYLSLLKEVDFSVDQSKCHSYGMNAIHSLFCGHIVFAPADEFCLRGFEKKSSPIISIYDNENDIYRKIKEVILLSEDEIDAIKEKSVEYATEVHSPAGVATEYLDLLGRR